MKKIFILLLSVGTLFLLFGLQGCSEDIPQSQPNSLDNLKLGKGMIRTDFQAGTTPVLLSQTTAAIDSLDGVFIKRTRMFEAGVAYDEHLIFNPINSYLYPGHVFVGNTISTGEYLPVKDQVINTVKIAPDLTPLRASVDFVKQYDDIRYTDYMLALQEWRSQDFRKPAASSSFSVDEVHSRIELGLKGDFNFSFQGGSVGISPDFNFTQDKVHVLVKMVQKIFSVGMDIPKGGILKSVNVADLNGVVPVYISDIYYGRLIYAVFASTSTAADLRAAIKASFQGGGGTLNLKYKEILEKSDIQAILIGGDATAHAQVLNGWDALKKALQRNVEVSTAAPISFSLRYADDNSAARTHYTGKYPILESYFIPNCESITFTFRASHLLGVNSDSKDVRMHGNCTLTTPTGEKVTLFNRNSNQYIVTKTEDGFQYIGDLTSKVEVTVKKPAGMSMKDFLEKQKVKIDTHLMHNIGGLGLVNGANLGSASNELTLEDLIFQAENGSISLGTRANRLRDFRGALRFELSYKTNK